MEERPNARWSGTARHRAWPTTNSTACWPRARGHSYTGFWTYDPGTVGTVLDELDALAE
jgi:hypothetical protein